MFYCTDNGGIFIKLNIAIGIIEISIYLVCLAYAITTAVKRYRKKKRLALQGFAIQYDYERIITPFRFQVFALALVPCLLILNTDYRTEDDCSGIWISFTIFLLLIATQLLMQKKQRGYVYFDDKGVRFINDENRLIPYWEIEEACWSDHSYVKGAYTSLRLKVNGKNVYIRNIFEEDFDLKIAPHIKNHSKKYRHPKRKNSN